MSSDCNKIVLKITVRNTELISMISSTATQRESETAMPSQRAPITISTFRVLATGSRHSDDESAVRVLGSAYTRTEALRMVDSATQSGQSAWIEAQ